MSKLELKKLLKNVDVDIYGRAEKNGAKKAVEKLYKLAGEAIKEVHKRVDSLDDKIELILNSCSSEAKKLKNEIEELRSETDAKLAFKADIPCKIQECLNEWAKEGRKYCNDTHVEGVQLVELTASKIGDIIIESSKGDARFLADCHLAITGQNADYVICSSEHGEL